MSATIKLATRRHLCLEWGKNMHLLISCIIHHVRSDGHGAKKWQSTDAGIQSHAIKAVTAFLGCLSTEMLRLPPIKVNWESVAEINCAY